MKVLQHKGSPTVTKKEHKNFYIFDYYLDGYFLKWEEVVDCKYPSCGEFCSIILDDGTEISPQVVETEKISEDEVKIFLSSYGIKIIPRALRLESYYISYF